MESGMSLAADEISRLVDSEGEATSKYRERTLRFTDSKAEEYKCSHKSAAEALAEWQDGARSMPFEAPMEIDGHSVAVHGEKRTVELDTDASGRMEYTFGFSDIYDSTLTGQWVRHVAGHAAGFRFVSALMCRNPKATVKTFPPIPQDEAKRLLKAIVRTAMKPWPFDAGLVGDWESDVVPEDIRAAIGFDKGRIVATDGRGGKRK